MQQINSETPDAISDFGEYYGADGRREKVKGDLAQLAFGDF
jgi:hypothetical protein